MSSPSFPCQLCLSSPSTPTLLKCCQLFLCSPCHSRTDKLSQCPNPNCQKTLIPKKYFQSDIPLHTILNNFYRNKPVECSRCDQGEGVEYCEDCQENFCQGCMGEIHEVGLYQGHRRVALGEVEKVLEAKRGAVKEEVCEEHKMRKEFVCQCSYSNSTSNATPALCSMCLKSHRQTCIKKHRQYSEHKRQHFSLMLQKLSQISKYKQYLLHSSQQYLTHYTKQKTLYTESLQYLNKTFQNYIKLIEFKRNELKLELERYWEECERVYEKNEIDIKGGLKEFDRYAMMIPEFAERGVGLEYLEKRLSVKNVEFEGFAWKVVGLEGVEREIMAVGSWAKRWSGGYQVLELKEKQKQKEKSSIRSREFSGQSSSIINLNSLSNTLNTLPSPNSNPLTSTLPTTLSNPAQLTQIHQNPLLPRPLKLIASTRQIQYTFLHLPYQKLKYQIQFGVGIKTKGQQVFKRISANENGKGLIKGLHPSTNYRIRMRVQSGSWSDIYQIQTQPPQCFSIQNTNFAKIDTKGHILLLRSGTMYGLNGYEFGVHHWELKIVVDKTAHHQSETACISIGISNRDNKKAIFVGSTINYGFQRENLKFRIMVDCDNNRMVVWNENKGGEEVYGGIPDYPVFPTIVNKGNSMVQLMVTF